MALVHTTTPSSSPMSLRQRLGVGGCEKQKELRRLRRANEYKRCILNDDLANRRSVPIPPILLPSPTNHRNIPPVSLHYVASSQAGRFTENNSINLQTYYKYLVQKNAGIHRSLLYNYLCYYNVHYRFIK